MDETEMRQYMLETFDGVEAVDANGDTFFFYDPEQKIPADRRFPFVTLVNSDNYDSVSNLSRPSVYRLNIGVSKDTYRSLFGPQPSPPGASGIVNTGHDFATLDKLLPHPTYAPQSWISVLNPGEKTLETVKSLLTEAHATAARRY